MRTAHCPRCRTRKAVVDTDTAHTYRPHGEVTMQVAILECWHTIPLSAETVTGAAPGRPYAGPTLAGRVVAVDPYGLAQSA